MANQEILNYIKQNLEKGITKEQIWEELKRAGPYGWIDNTRDSQRFCAYADLEKDGFLVATHGGMEEITTEPRTLSDCERFPGFIEW